MANYTDGTLALQPATPNYPSTDPLMAKGWVKDTIGQFRSNGKIKNKDGFILYIRRRNLAEFIDNYSKKSSSKEASNPSNNGISMAGSSTHTGTPEQNLTPHVNINGSKKMLPTLSSFSEYPSLLATRKDDPCLLIAYDSEWNNIKAGKRIIGREMLSWQFALIDGNDLVEFVFLRDGDKNLHILDAIGCILDHLGKYSPVDVRDIRKYKYCSKWEEEKPVEETTDDLQEARKHCKYVYRKEIGFTEELIEDMPDRFTEHSFREWSFFHTYYDYSKVESIKVCLLCHTGLVDLSALEYGKKNLLPYLSEIQGGLVSLKPVRYAPHSFNRVNNTYVYPVSLSVADTMCHAPAGKKKLKSLGEVIGVEKVDISDDQKDQMIDLFVNDIALFIEYASTDSVVTLLYASAMYGYNNTLPVTITSAAAEAMKEIMMKYLDCDSTDEFNRKYRGLYKVNHGKFKQKDRPGFVEATSLEPISNDANVIQSYASQAYHGGYNICTEVGSFPFETYDYDLQNAYPTAMCLVPDINWENPIRNEIIRRDMSLADFGSISGINPIAPFVGYIRFEFPDTCKYPCIPINVNGVPAYPLSSEGMNGVYVAGPFVWLALKLGAHVYCDRGYFLNTLYTNDYSRESRSLSAGVKQFIIDRNIAKHDKGKGSLEELILKTMVSSCYGKTAQNVIKKSSWTALKDIMEELGCSAITNPVSAMMITSIVQVELLAAQNQLYELGYMSCSVTTDGFISNCPEHILKNLDLYGLRRFMEAARLFLTGDDPELWEIKHAQDDLINFTTRGNVSLYWSEIDKETDNELGNPYMVNGKAYPGVCAHNSTKSGYESDSYEDRLWLMTKVLSRTGTVDYVEDEWTSFKDFVHGKPYGIDPKTRHIHMDFDMKRKPVRDSFTTDKVFVEGEEYEIAHFDTEPFKTIEEFKLYRAKKELMPVLRTEQDWDKFWIKIDLKATGAQPRNLNWAILNSCIMGYRAGLWDIPYLSQQEEVINSNGEKEMRDVHTVQEKCDWINLHNTSGKVFKPSDWKNARRPERQVNMLPREMIEDKLTELINDI